MCLQVLPEILDKGAEKQKKSGSKPAADSLPAIATSESKLVVDTAAKARGLGLCVGCDVLVGDEKRPAKFLELLEAGGAKVNFTDNKAEGGTETRAQTVPLEILTVLQLADTKKAKPVRPVDSRQPGKDWASLSEVKVESSVHDFTKSFLFQLHGQLCPPKELLRYHVEDDGEHFSLNYAVKAGGLIFVPFTQRLSEASRGVKRCRLSGKSAEMPVPGPDITLPVVRVKKTDLNAEPMYMIMQASSGPFWKFLQGQEHQSQDVPNLTFKILKDSVFAVTC